MSFKGFSRKLEEGCDSVVYEYNPRSVDWSEYFVVKRLGSGSEGEVLQLKHVKLNEYVAAKVVEKKRNRNELEILKKVDHPNIVRLLGFQSTGTRDILYLEYIEGETLHDFLMENRKLSSVDIYPIYKQIFDALQYLHGKSIAHMDIKTDNVVIDKSGKVKLIDFGNSVDHSVVMAVTKMVGSFHYGAPEIHLNQPYSGFPCDVFSLHVLFAVCVKGNFCWNKAHESDENYLEFVNANARLPSFRKVSEDEFDFLKRVLVHNPSDRPSLSEIKTDQCLEELRRIWTTCQYYKSLEQ